MKRWCQAGQPRRVVLRAVCLGALYWGYVLDLRADDMAAEDIKQLVVMIDAKLEGADRFGAGIIFGVDADDLYIVTANHVVREGGLLATDIQLRFHWMPDEPVKANLLAQADPKLDLAVLQVAGLNAIKNRTDFLPFEEVRDPSSLQRGGGVYLLGYPLRKAWRMNVTPERFAEANGDFLEFESSFLARGHSGGALLDADMEIIGMLKSEDPPYGEAVSIAAIAERLRGWNYPVGLGRPPTPAAFSSLSAGGYYICGATTSGSAYCWAKGLGSSGFSLPVRVRGGPFQTVTTRTRTGTSLLEIEVHSCGLTVGERAYCWGSNKDGELGNGLSEDSLTPVPVSGGLNFKSLTAGGGFTCGITVGGASYCWGAIIPPSKVPDKEKEGVTFLSVSAGEFSVYAVTSDGRFECWEFECADPPRQKVSFQSASNPCVLATTGTAYCVKKRRLEKIPGDVVFRSISADGFNEEFLSACGVTMSGSVFCWGYGFQKDTKTKKSSHVPIPLAGGLTFKSVSVGTGFACGIATWGPVYCWGEGLGDVPVQFPATAK